jgi:hypothetical protein
MRKFIFAALAVGVGLAVLTGHYASDRHKNVVAAIALFFGLVAAILLFARLYAWLMSR